MFRGDRVRPGLAHRVAAISCRDLPAAAKEENSADTRLKPMPDRNPARHVPGDGQAIHSRRPGLGSPGPGHDRVPGTAGSGHGGIEARRDRGRPRSPGAAGSRAPRSWARRPGVGSSTSSARPSAMTPGEGASHTRPDSRDRAGTHSSPSGPGTPHRRNRAICRQQVRVWDGTCKALGTHGPAHVERDPAHIPPTHQIMIMSTATTIDGTRARDDHGRRSSRAGGPSPGADARTGTNASRVRVRRTASGAPTGRAGFGRATVER